ncbi:GSCFA domain-containing protein [Hyunsoonleella flava]|uniref:GSCFA domain-containing protein n=1 Tax=Hyunsoonleella flava TaxID=2527939 RepID=A0A4Q9FC70_9FLAO|nr:GSCFA domain-containing protein [Hyunsoonleella flava]TBN00872.1 GSCFA domain-containing protein [Hyunsoonleella flava]
MNLQTKIPVQKQPNYLIDYNSKIILLGSCFSENIGKKLDYFKFQNIQNPFGVLFHPKAIETLLSRAINEKRYFENDVFFHSELWHCFDAHSGLSDMSKDKLVSNLNSELKNLRKSIVNTTHVIITLGTAWVYRFLESDKIVANCHKVPQKEFKKELLSVEDVCQSLENITSLLKRINSKATIIFTLSPVRHLKDGFIENTQSKSHLVAGIHQFLNEQSSTNHQQSFYFPSYETMMDELRDYRFYAEDMIHPNPTAINYIWEQFRSVWISEESFQIMEKVDTVQKGLQHKPFNPNSKAHKKFLRKLEVQKESISKRSPHIRF